MHQANKINVPQCISPEMQEVLRYQQEHPSEIEGDGLAAMRAKYNEERSFWNEGGPTMFKTVEHEVPFRDRKIKTRVYYPCEKPESVIFFIHGGGFVVGNIDTHNRIMRMMADFSQCAVVGIDYSLSPEVKFPEPIEECVAACQFYKAHEKEFGLNMENIGFAGDSAGAYLSMATCLWMRDHNIHCGNIKGMLLYYGLYGLKDSVSRRLFGGEWDWLRKEDLIYYNQMFLANEEQEESPYFCLFNNDLTHDVPPCYIVAAEFDPLLDDSALLYATLVAHGTYCEYVLVAGVLHAYLHNSKMLPVAEESIQKGADFYRRQLGSI